MRIFQSIHIITSHIIISIILILNFADQLSKAQKIGLKHFDDFEKRIPRPEIEKVEALISRHVAGIDKRYRSTICGSYRRGLPTSGDIDMLVTHPTFTSLSSGSQGGGQLLRTVVEVLETEGKSSSF